MSKIILKGDVGKSGTSEESILVFFNLGLSYPIFFLKSLQ